MWPVQKSEIVGFQDKANFLEKMASRRDRFWGIKIPGFFCPAGTYDMYEL